MSALPDRDLDALEEWVAGADRSQRISLTTVGELTLWIRNRRSDEPDPLALAFAMFDMDLDETAETLRKLLAGEHIDVEERYHHAARAYRGEVSP